MNVFQASETRATAHTKPSASRPAARIISVIFPPLFVIAEGGQCVHAPSDPNLTAHDPRRNPWNILTTHVYPMNSSCHSKMFPRRQAASLRVSNENLIPSRRVSSACTPHPRVITLWSQLPPPTTSRLINNKHAYSKHPQNLKSLPSSRATHVPDPGTDRSHATQ